MPRIIQARNDADVPNIEPSPMVVPTDVAELLTRLSPNQLSRYIEERMKAETERQRIAAETTLLRAIVDKEGTTPILVEWVCPGLRVW